MFAGSGDTAGRAEPTSPALAGKPQTQGPDEGLSRVEGDGRIGVMPKGCGVILGMMETFLNWGGDGCTLLWLHQKPLSCALEMGELCCCGNYMSIKL